MRTDSYGNEIQPGATIIWREHGDDKVGTVEADPKWEGGMRVGGRSIKDICYSADWVRLVQ